MNKKVKAYFDNKIKVEKTHPRDWNLKDRFYWIEFLALNCGIRVIMEGKDISGETVCSNDLDYTPHHLEDEEKDIFKCKSKYERFTSLPPINFEGFK